MGTAEVLLRSLAGHKSLQRLGLGQDAGAPDGLGPALAALVAADAPALQDLDVSAAYDAEAPPFLSEAIVAPILDALQHNHHLRSLGIGNINMSEEFARERLLPALHANTSLRWLALYCVDESPAAEAVAEAVALVKARPPVD